MLILTRTIGEKIQIGDNIVVTVLNRRGNHIVIGIDAPREIPIKRTELEAPPPATSPKKIATRQSLEHPTDSSLHIS